MKVQHEMRDHAANLISEKFAEMEKLIDRKLAPYFAAMPTIDDFRAEISEQIVAIKTPEFDLTPAIDEFERRMNIALASQGSALKAEMLESVKMSMKAMQSGLVRGLQKELTTLEGPLEEYAEGVLEQAAASMNPQDMLLAQILSMDVSDKFAKENPLASMALRYGKMGMLQMVQSGAIPNIGNSPKGINTAQGNAPVKTSPFDGV